jgi:hypothetical protein
MRGGCRADHKHAWVHEDNRWVRGGPEHNGDPLRLLQQLRRDGVRTIAVDPSVNEVDFSLAGLYPLAAAEGISVSRPARA